MRQINGDWARFNSLPQGYEWVRADLERGRVAASDLVDLTLRFGRTGTVRRMGLLLERQGVQERLLAKLDRVLRPSSAYISRTPSLPKRGKIDRRWGVVVNEPELLEPGSVKFKITYDVSTARAGSEYYLNAIRAGSVATDESVIDLATGKELVFEVVTGAQAKEQGLASPHTPDDADRIRSLGRGTPVMTEHWTRKPQSGQFASDSRRAGRLRSARGQAPGPRWL